MTDPTPLADSGTPAWHAERAKGVGASEAAAAVGQSDHLTPLGLYNRKIGLEQVLEATEAMQRGILREPTIVAEFERLTGLRIKQYPVPLMTRGELAPMLATPDALLEDNSVLEAKSTTPWRMAQIRERFPADWYCQAQQQMAVLGAGVVRFGILVEGGSLELMTVERDDAAIRWLLEGEQEFWARVLMRQPPAPDWKHASTPDLVKKLHGVEDGKRIELSAEHARLWKQQKRLGKHIDRMTKLCERLRAQVMFAMEDAAIGELPGEPIELTRQEIAGGILSYERKPYVKLHERKRR